jgi:signal transduction histidine kinase
MVEKPVRILLVDENENDYFLTRDLLADIPASKFQLDWLADPDAALQVISRQDHDLLLVDYRLGRIDGPSLIQTAIRLGCTAPMILLTGQEERAIDLEALQIEAADFLEKGRLDSAMLARSIRYALQGKRHSDQLERRVEERTMELALANKALQAEVAERIRTEEALRELDRRKDGFLSTMAHELRNPLVPIRNALEIMRLSKDQAMIVESSRAMIERQIKQIVRLIDDLLDVARISRGTIQLRKEQVEVSRVVADAVESCRSQIDRAGHLLTVSLPADTIFVDADPTRLTQILLNLLDNAIKYTEPGGRISLTVACDDGDVVLRVNDTGLGIPADMIDRVFEFFTQVSRSPDGPQSGLGIGLALVKTLVQLHEGSVEVRSAGPRQGSEFIVRLPLATPAIAE